MFVKQNYLFKKIVSFGAKSVIFDNCVFFFYKTVNKDNIFFGNYCSSIYCQYLYQYCFKMKSPQSTTSFILF